MSGFGDLVFDSTRAVSDDEDEEFERIEEDKSLKKTIHWFKNDSKINCDELILAYGQNSSAFVYTYLISHFKKDDVEILGSTENGTKTVTCDQEPSLRTNYLYLIRNSNGKKMVVCQLYDELRPCELYDWINQLTGKIEFKKTLMFCSQNKSSYLGLEEKTTFVRFISSNKSNQMNKVCQHLEGPNFVGDLSAALAHYCVAKNLEFTTFICYTPSLRADIHSIKEMFSAASSKLQENNPFINDTVSEKNLLSVDRIVSSVSAIYM